jgi:S-adenosylmethionine hydrolase
MIITLTTDFGLADPFVGIMKGVILGIAPEAKLVDITHDIGSYDILDGAFVIETSYRYFPQGSVHIVIVDPGVGSARRPMAAASHGHFFVAPDNGALSYVLDAEAEVHEITNRRLFLNSVSRTFHGRDIFAPVAAHLARGLPLESMGPRILNYTHKPIPRPHSAGGKLIATVLRIDKFGNLITNLRSEHLAGSFTVRLGGASISSLYSTFSEAPPGELFAVEGSAGYIELALNQGSAAERLKVNRGAEIEVETTFINQ